MDKSDRLHSNLSSFIRVIGIGTELTFVSVTIAIADGVTVAAHWPNHSSELLNPCSTAEYLPHFYQLMSVSTRKRALNNAL